MKKVTILLLTAVLLVFSITAYAGDLGVQIIGGDENKFNESISLDDLKLNNEIELPGYGFITAIEFGFLEEIGYYHENGYAYSYEGSNSDQYAWLYFTILNKRTTELNFMTDITDIVVTYDNTYKYAGWTMQCNLDKGNPRYGDMVQFAIKPMYLGAFFVACTLPNAVVEGSEPLKMTFKIGENEITYNIRK